MFCLEVERVSFLYTKVVVLAAADLRWGRNSNFRRECCL